MKEVQHFKILSDAQSRYYIWSKKFDSLNKLVDHYRVSTVSLMRNITLRDFPTADAKEGKTVFIITHVITDTFDFNLFIFVYFRY